MLNNSKSDRGSFIDQRISLLAYTILMPIQDVPKSLLYFIYQKRALQSVRRAFITEMLLLRDKVRIGPLHQLSGFGSPQKCNIYTLYITIFHDDFCGITCFFGQKSSKTRTKEMGWGAAENGVKLVVSAFLIWDEWVARVEVCDFRGSLF